MLRACQLHMRKKWSYCSSLLLNSQIGTGSPPATTPGNHALPLASTLNVLLSLPDKAIGNRARVAVGKQHLRHIVGFIPDPAREYKNAFHPPGSRRHARSRFAAFGCGSAIAPHAGHSQSVAANWRAGRHRPNRAGSPPNARKRGVRRRARFGTPSRRAGLRIDACRGKDGRKPAGFRRAVGKPALAASRRAWKASSRLASAECADARIRTRPLDGACSCGASAHASFPPDGSNLLRSPP